MTHPKDKGALRSAKQNRTRKKSWVAEGPRKGLNEKQSEQTKEPH